MEVSHWDVALFRLGHIIHPSDGLLSHGTEVSSGVLLESVTSHSSTWDIDEAINGAISSRTDKPVRNSVF